MLLTRAKKAALAATAHLAGHTRELLGAKPQFCIRGGYKHRSSCSYFDSTAFKDDWQREVYLRAAAIMDAERLETVYDVGCGSGYKLVRYLGKYDTTGFEVPETLEFLRKTYPDRKWAHVPLSDRSYAPCDLMICADVIEHVENPDELMGFLVSLTGGWLVLSTPDRGMLYRPFSRYQFGPPINPAHVREWDFDEFHRYVSQFVSIHEHVISKREQGTQMIVGRINLH